MPDALAQALALPGLGWLIGAVFIAGIVRGFSGFGTAMIYLPVAATVLDPIWAILTLVVFDLFGPAVIAPRAVRDMHLPDLGWLLVGTAVGLPFGLSLLFVIAPETFRLVVSIVTLFLLVCLIAGLRYPGALRRRVLAGAGALGGALGGAAGAAGPPVIFLFMGSGLPAARVRATITLFLLAYDVILLGVFWGTGRLDFVPLSLGLLLSLPNAAGNFCGALLFRPGYERAYRYTAYAVIACSALTGLPIWG